jgi:hypothetical protein
MNLSKKLESIKLSILKNIQDGKPCNGEFLKIRNDLEIKRELKEITMFLDNEYEIIETGQRVWHLIKEKIELEKCICGKNKAFYRFSNGYFNTCGEKSCKNKKKSESFKKTIVKNYDGNYFKKGTESFEKYRNTMISRYGVDHNFKGDMRDKSKEKLKEKYGVEHPLRSQEIRDKRRETCMSKYGTLDFLNSDKSKKTLIEKYGVDNPMKNENIKKNVSSKFKENSLNKLNERLKKFNTETIKYTKEKVKIICNKCGSYTENHSVTINSKIRFNIDPCSICNPPNLSSSNLETELREYISSIYKNDILPNKKLIKHGGKSFEVDIYLPEIKTAFEFNGLYWHSEIYKSPEYHIFKTDYAKKIDVDLYHIWEDDWNYKKEIVKSIILSRIKKTEKIWARKCEIKEITNKEYLDFCENNHLQGHGISSIRIALFYEDDIVSVMGFSKNRKLISGKKDTEYELVRFCSKLGITVVGSASKMLKYFETKYNPSSLISYCDISISPDQKKSIYSKCGFELEYKTNPGYSWVIDGKRHHRLNFTKNKLIKSGEDPNLTNDEIMWNKGYYKIWDCGNFRFIKDYGTNKKD